MNTHIKTVHVNMFDGILSGTIPFNPGLNILSGENGTCKTKILQQIKNGIQITHHSESGQSGVKILGFSPKRNSERKNFENICRELRQQNRDINIYMNERIGAQLQDNTFEKYSSLGELYYYIFEKECKDGGNQIEKMNKVTNQFNLIIQKIFDNYELISEWDQPQGNPKINLKKYDSIISLESLSCGEQEMLSLALNLYVSRDTNDIFLIDEPEIHLNWHLEEMLFDYFAWFCNKYKKQIIVATHSRIVFKSNFLDKTQFLFWEDDKILFGKDIPIDQHKKIAGEAIEIIKLGEFSKPTFFVEDKNHVEIIMSIANSLGVKISAIDCGNSTNVKSLYKFQLSEDGWKNSFFLVDGDNQGNPFPDSDQFIHLDKYCIENYFFNFKTASNVTKKSEREIKEAVLKSIKKNRNTILKKNKYFEFLFDRLKITDITESTLDKLDCSEIFPGFLKEIKMRQKTYIDKYIKILKMESKLKVIFPNILIENIQNLESLP